MFWPIKLKDNLEARETEISPEEKKKDDVNTKNRLVKWMGQS